MLSGDSEITVQRLQEIIELTLELEPPEELGLAIQELIEEVYRLQVRVSDLVRFIETETGGPISGIGA